MLGTILLIIGIVGLVFALLSLIGLDFGDLDVHLGDSGVGVLSALSPFLTGLGLVGGGLLVFTGVSTVPALLIGGGVGVMLAVLAVALMGYLVGSEEEVPTFDLVGKQVRVTEPVGPSNLGSGEVQTRLGGQIVSLMAEESYAHNEKVWITAKDPDRNVYRVERMPFDG